MNTSMPRHAAGLSLPVLLTVLIFVLLLLVPVYASLTDSPYVLLQFSRILVFALAAVGLNLALGYGGLVSFGHAMYIGIGAYCVAVASHYGADSGVLHLLLVVLVTALVAAPVGLIALRTHGIAFIMITLALAQMFYFLAVGLKQYGGDEGLPIRQLSHFGTLTGSHVGLYLALLACLGGSLLLLRRVIRSRFGLILRASSMDARRVQAVGTTPLGYRLMAYVLSAELCALAGFFLANLTSFASPAYMAWTASGELIIMVLLGGAGTLVGPVVGAAGFLLLEDVLKGLTDHWMIIMGPVIVLIVLFLRNGLWGMIGASKEGR
ncbi:branched-chain amino acid ABC transporter permease [Castellaniella sp.]|uniref:branched-chain amino acid ABC transporter permease n=1 Tax=Castellaniella sp. TaxID=1955812 RepID=UPI002AFE5336|nr:branched-chain amino acid ABC transporter permease [Castellaniella sp.]